MSVELAIALIAAAWFVGFALGIKEGRRQMLARFKDQLWPEDKRND